MNLEKNREFKISYSFTVHRPIIFCSLISIHRLSSIFSSLIFLVHRLRYIWIFLLRFIALVPFFFIFSCSSIQFHFVFTFFLVHRLTYIWFFLSIFLFIFRFIALVPFFTFSVHRLRYIWLIIILFIALFFFVHYYFVHRPILFCSLILVHRLSSIFVHFFGSSPQIYFVHTFCFTLFGSLLSVHHF